LDALNGKSFGGHPDGGFVVPAGNLASHQIGVAFTVLKFAKGREHGGGVVAAPTATHSPMLVFRTANANVAPTSGFFRGNESIASLRLAMDQFCRPSSNSLD
jgi:hypothetical protein